MSGPEAAIRPRSDGRRWPQALLWGKLLRLFFRGIEVNMLTTIDDRLLAQMDALWRASNYLSVGQIYLLDNPLLKRPLLREDIKPRLLGHWGTTPDLNLIYVIGPGHGGPALVAQAYLEGTYSEVYPNISQNELGMKRLFKQFSFPGGIPSHV